jgi:uncharacterized membrane protein YjfL (UPF0719 family)
VAAAGTSEPGAASIHKENTMMGYEWLRPAAVFGSLLYALIGVLVFWVCFVIIDKITPYDLWAEIVEKKNLALAIVVAAMCIAIGLIVSAAVHG